VKKTDSPEMRPAMEFEHLTALRRGPYATLALYGIEGTPGVFRRIARTATGLNVGTIHSTLARWQGGVIELVRCPEIDEELAMVGMNVGVRRSPPVEAPPPPVEVNQPTLLDRIEAGEVVPPAEIKESAGVLMEAVAPPEAAAEEMTAGELLALSRQEVEQPLTEGEPEAAPEVEQPKRGRKVK
jgi:hypothetical protein